MMGSLQPFMTLQHLGILRGTQLRLSTQIEP